METDTSVLTRVLGAVMVLMVVIGWLPWLGGIKMNRWGFGPLGGVAGFLASYVGIPGPFIAIFFLAYGLTPAAYLGTASLGLALIQVTKLAVYGPSALLSVKVAVLGLALGAIALGGSLVGRWIVGRIPEKLFAGLDKLGGARLRRAVFGTGLTASPWVPVRMSSGPISPIPPLLGLRQALQKYSRSSG